MKKFFVASMMLILSIIAVPAPSSAVEQKALVIIDSYFDSRAAGFNYSCVTVSGSACKDVRVTQTSVTYPGNHGNAMVEIARKQSSTIPIIGLAVRTASSPVAANNFIDALKWVKTNSYKVSAVSFSGYFDANDSKTCRPYTAYTGYTPTQADTIIRGLISELKTLNIAVFISTGNAVSGGVTHKNVLYPGCIVDTVSVSTGVANSLGLPVSVDRWNNDTDHFVSSKSVYLSSIFGKVGWTTSPATAAAAAKWVANGRPDSKFESVLS